MTQLDRSRFYLELLPYHLLLHICDLLTENNCFQDVLNLRLTCFSIYQFVNDFPLKLKQTFQLPIDLVKMSEKAEFMLSKTNWSYNRIEFCRQKLLEGPDNLMKTTEAVKFVLTYNELYLPNLQVITLDAMRIDYECIFTLKYRDYIELNVKSFRPHANFMRNPKVSEISTISKTTYKHVKMLHEGGVEPKGLQSLEIFLPRTQSISLPVLHNLKFLGLQNFDTILVNDSKAIQFPSLKALVFKAPTSLCLENGGHIQGKEWVSCDLRGLTYILQNSPKLEYLDFVVNPRSVELFRRSYLKLFELALPPNCAALKTLQDTCELMTYRGSVEKLCIYDVYSFEHLLTWLGNFSLKILNVVTIHWEKLYTKQSLLEITKEIIKIQPKIEVISIRKSYDHKRSPNVKLSSDNPQQNEELVHELGIDFKLSTNLKLIIIEDEAVFISPNLSLSLMRQIDLIDEKYDLFIRKDFKI